MGISTTLTTTLWCYKGQTWQHSSLPTSLPCVEEEPSSPAQEGPAEVRGQTSRTEEVPGEERKRPEAWERKAPAVIAGKRGELASCQEA